jgi:serine/threonine-protein kinase
MKGSGADHQSSSPPIPDHARQRIGSVLRGKYRLDAVLGVGGMAVVYRATHRNQAEYAIKMLLPEHCANESVRRRFLREGYAANSVKHAGTVRVVDDDISEDGAAFLVLELLDGMACDKLAHGTGGSLHLDAVCAIALQTLDVLEAAHAKGIVHRDIKPANLFVLRDGAIKVLDFGIARFRESVATLTHTTGGGMLLGTPAFMAPEQALGRASDIDARVDIWGLGATIFTLATGVTVHEADSAQGLLIQLVTQPARSLASAAPDAPRAIVDVVDRALLVDRDRRWPSAGAMRIALEQASRQTFGEPLSLGALVTQLRFASAPPAANGDEAKPSPDKEASWLSGPTAADGLAATGPALPEASAKAESLASRPVSRDEAFPHRAPRRRAIVVAGALVVLGTLAVAIVAGMGGRGTRHYDSRTTVRAESVPPSEKPASPPSVSDQSTQEAAPAPTLLSSKVALPRVVPRPASPSAATASRDAASQAIAPAGEAPKGAELHPVERLDGAPSCTPPFYYDSAHNRVFKKECL